MEKGTKNPKTKQNQKSKKVSFSDSTNKGSKKNLNMDGSLKMYQRNRPPRDFPRLILKEVVEFRFISLM